MPLLIYRRHTTDCKVHSLNLKPRERRHYRNCGCAIWISGTTENNEYYPRQSLQTRDWAVAEAKLRSIQARAADVVAHGITITEAIREHLDSHAENITPRTLINHRRVLGQFEKFARSRNKTFMREVDVDTCERFKTVALKHLETSTKGNAVSKLRFFLREAFRREWITDALHERVRPIRAVYEPAQPFRPGEVQSILLEATRMNGGSTGYAAHPHTFVLLLQLMLETGLRVSDAIRFDPTHCTRSDHLWVYRFKPVKQRKNGQQRHMEVFLTDKLKTAIDQAEWFSKQYPFAYRTFPNANANPNANTQENQVYRRMQTIGEKCGVADCRPHRLRDTYAVQMLLRGVSLDNVSRLLGHSSVKITEAHYAAWTPARQHHLEGTVAQALMNPLGN